MGARTNATKENEDETTMMETSEEIAEDSTDEIKMVKIRLIKDNNDYKDDVFVCVNGMSYLIQRGVDVEVPYFVAEVIENSYNQDMRTAELIKKEVSKYENNRQ